MRGRHFPGTARPSSQNNRVKEVIHVFELDVLWHLRVGVWKQSERIQSTVSDVANLRFQDLFNFRLHLGHPSGVATDANDSRLEVQRDEFPLVAIPLAVHVASNLNRNLPLVSEEMQRCSH